MVKCLHIGCSDDALEKSAYCAEHRHRRSMELGLRIEDRGSGSMVESEVVSENEHDDSTQNLWPSHDDS